MIELLPYRAPHPLPCVKSVVHLPITTMEPVIIILSASPRSRLACSGSIVALVVDVGSTGRRHTDKVGMKRTLDPVDMLQD